MAIDKTIAKDPIQDSPLADGYSQPKKKVRATDPDLLLLRRLDNIMAEITEKQRAFSLSWLMTKWGAAVPVCNHPKLGGSQ